MLSKSENTRHNKLVVIAITPLTLIHLITPYICIVLEYGVIEERFIYNIQGGCLL